MKSFDRIPFLANVLIVACSRPNAEVGKLVKALVTYATEGTRTDLGDLRLEAYFDLLIQDIYSLRTAAEAKSKKCSESAKCRAARNASSPANLQGKRMQRTQVQVNPKQLQKHLRHRQSQILQMLPTTVMYLRILTKSPI